MFVTWEITTGIIGTVPYARHVLNCPLSHVDQKMDGLKCRCWLGIQDFCHSPPVWPCRRCKGASVPSVCLGNPIPFLPQRSVSIVSIVVRYWRDGESHVSTEKMIDQ